MEIGRDWDPVWKNRWPQEPDCPGFKDTMLKFFQVGRNSLQERNQFDLSLFSYRRVMSFMYQS